jgi:hypothetical protein
VSRAETLRRFRQALLGYAILAVACIAGITYNFSQQRELNDHQDSINLQLKQIKHNQEAIVSLTRNVAAAVCLEAFATTNAQRRALVLAFNRTGRIDLSGSPTCQRTAREAINLIVK